MMLSPQQSAALLLFSSAFKIVVGHGAGFGINPSHSGAEITVRFGEAQNRDLGNWKVEKRQACGAAVGSCPAGQCCSSGGQCGTGGAFCAGPGCQVAYGPACDGNTIPPGASTLNISRQKVGNILYGQMLYHCTTPNAIALTFDDGPWTYTQDVLNTLAKYNVHATFFITGNNAGKGRIDDPSTPWPNLLKSMYAAGHQLASHTWSHEDLTQLPANLLQNQVIYNEMAFRNIFGFVPTYIRPPYGFCAGASGCLDFLNSMAYHVITWDIDTKDYANDDPSLIQNSKNWFAGNTSNPAGGHSYIELSHDTHNQTALTLVSYMLDTLLARGYKAVTVGECMGDPRTNWYRDAGGIPSSSFAAPAPTTSSSTSSSTLALAPATSSSTSSSTSAPAPSTSASKPTSSTSSLTKFTALAASTPSAQPNISTITLSTSPTKNISIANSTFSVVSPKSTKSEANGVQASVWIYGLFVTYSLAVGLGMGL